MLSPNLLGADEVRNRLLPRGEDVVACIEDCYRQLHPTETGFKKYVLGEHAHGKILAMPYLAADGLFFQKTICLNSQTRPGITGFVTVAKEGVPILVMEATEFTGIRTAAKSVVLAKTFLAKDDPHRIVLIGSSVQSFYHTLFMLQHFGNATAQIVCRTQAGMEQLRERLAAHPEYSARVAYMMREDAATLEPDVLVTLTNSRSPVVTEEIACKAKVIVTVGSSNGETTEIPLAVVPQCQVVVDSFVSIEGKGELNLALDAGTLKRSQIRNLASVLSGSESLCLNRPVLAVSKGIVLEDVAVIRRFFLENT